MPGALDGIRVIDCSRRIAGSYAALLLAEQGADVIRLESPGGDALHGTPAHHVFNRSKRAAVADLENAAGRTLALRLIAGADVLIDDGSPAEQARRGLTWQMLAAANPALVFCWLPPYGSCGPHAERAADDALAAALDGIAGTQFARHAGPTFLTVPLTSYGTALLAAGAACAALYVRERCGAG